MELSPTGRVILGLLSFEPRSGYDIKSVVDRTTRFFWTASYGQIYPELRRLRDAGLVAADDEPQGARRRTTYRITDAGRRALEAWIREPAQTHEMRDEGLLKLFFSGELDRDASRSVLRAKREAHERKLAQLREIEPLATQAPRFGPLAVLRYGIGMSEFAIAWCDRTLAELEQED